MLMGAVAVFAAFLTIAIDEHLGVAAFDKVTWMYTRDAQGARDLLSTIASSLINVIGIVFSITLVTLTIASSQFGTRILRNFARDTGNKLVLGTFVGTYLYCLLVLRTITGESVGSFVPHLSIAIGILLAILCLALLVFFIHHVISMVQSDNVVQMLAEGLSETINRMYPEQIGKEIRSSQQKLSPPSDLERNSIQIRSTRSGYLESIDDDRLMEIATKNDLIVRIERVPGDFLLHGSTLFLAYPSRPAKACEQDLLRAAAIESRRSYVQDIGFAFEQLVLVGVRALSPAMNNQILGMACIDRLCAALAQVSRRQIPSAFRADDKDRLRVIAPPVGYQGVVDSALTLISEAAAENSAVTVHMLNAISQAIEEIEINEFQDELLKKAQELRTRAVQLAKDDIARRHVEAAYAALNANRRAA